MRPGTSTSPTATGRNARTDVPWDGSTISAATLTAYGPLWRRTPRQSSGNAGRGTSKWSACPDCGRPANFKSDGKDFLILGCPHCRLWAKKAQTIAGLVDEWSKLADRKREENKRKNGSAELADLLNGLDEQHGENNENP